MNTLELFETKHELAVAAAEHAVLTLGAAITKYGSATWVLAGGTTPEVAYSIIADKYLDAIDWSHVTFIMGDERITQFDSPDSNWHQIEEVLLQYMPRTSFLRPDSDLDACDAAKEYDRRLRELPKNSHKVPRFDLLWLGMGEDGHTLSLFPGHDSLASTKAIIICETKSPKPPADRITLSLRGVTGAVECVIIVAGEAKAEALSAALADSHADNSLPVRLAADAVESAGGDVTWFVDRTAASRLIR